MESLLQIFNEEEIINLININPSIKNTDNENISKLINILNGLNLDINRLKNIIMSNPFFLSRDVSEVEELFKCLRDNNINKLDVIIDTYPLFLSYSDYDILDFIDLKLSEGLEKCEIIELIEMSPYLIDEI